MEEPQVTCPEPSLESALLETFLQEEGLHCLWGAHPQLARPQRGFKLLGLLLRTACRGFPHTSWDALTLLLTLLGRNLPVTAKAQVLALCRHSPEDSMGTHSLNPPPKPTQEGGAAHDQREANHSSWKQTQR